MDTTRPHASQSESPTGRYVVLFPPKKMTAIERRLADVIRHDLRLREDSPPGIYLVAAEQGDAMRIVVKRGKNASPGSEVSESTTAVDSFLSAVSESTLETPDSSNTPFKVADTATKFSEPTFRVEDQPPQMLGSYVGLTYTDKPLENMEYDAVRDKTKGGMYRLQITIYFQGHKVAFNLQADTGANNAWLFHQKVCLLEGIKDDWRPEADKPCTITLIAETKRPAARPALPESYMPSYLAKKIDAGTPSGESFDTTSHFHYPRISYSSGRSKLVVGPMASPIDLEINNVYKWRISGSDERDTLKARFSFAICDAATAEVFGDLRVDGLIGFGPEVNMNVFNPPFRHEQDYDESTNYPSFSTALEDSLPNVDGEEGIVLFWYLNPPGFHKGPSFLAFNEFPEHLLRQKLSWTAPILIASLESRPSYRSWVVTIKKLKIHLIADKEYQEQRGYEDQELLIDFGDKGEKFCVDTGCSTTMFPPEAVYTLRTDLDRGNPYSVPEWVDLMASTVEYTFVPGFQPGRPTEEVVFVTQAHHFLCDENRQGLIWDSPWDESENHIRCILGLPCIVLNLKLESHISDSHPWLSTSQLRRLNFIVFIM
ncbi:hypothetical protein GSI_09512 [Ganoderma sinense ZZ0214-1]|uniref:Uncharacterized protein n=1 Tax=Ganoderma sinense ZZ0214-1 TaxID=1077348 RepID=A0A2G8S3M3_9APHY|nr:hypothetical protein GSI_09512 [Ganoderma sinense ZZ0214-1]